MLKFAGKDIQGIEEHFIPLTVEEAGKTTRQTTTLSDSPLYKRLKEIYESVALTVSTPDHYEPYCVRDNKVFISGKNYAHNMLYPVARVYDGRGRWGRLFVWMDIIHIWHHWAMPESVYQNTHNMLDILVNHGFDVDHKLYSAGALPIHDFVSWVSGKVPECVAHCGMLRSPDDSGTAAF